MNKFDYAYKNRKNDFDLPMRSTKHSAGYDFHSPVDFNLPVGATISLNLLVNCQLDEDKVLLIMPRSSVGIKYKVTLDNTVGVIDSDYYPNEIHLTITNNGTKDYKVNKNDKICQGVIVKYEVTEDDDVDTIRTGGIGSTGK